MDLSMLAEMNEWAAYGFYEGEALPHPRQYGLAYRRMYENMPVRVDDHSLLLPFEPFYGTLEDTTGNSRHHALSGILGHFHCSGLEVWRECADIRKQQFPHYAQQIDALVEDLLRKVPGRLLYCHSNPDIYTVVDKGFGFIKQELRDSLAAAYASGDEEGIRFLLALEDYSRGVDALYQRTLAAIDAAAHAAEGSRQAELRVIGDAFRHSFEQPADSFIGGLLAVHFTWLLDGCDSVGRVDYALHELFERDLDSGRLDIAFARRLLDELFLHFEQQNGWNMQIGGYCPDGSCLNSRLTLELLLCSARNKLIRPNLALRINKKTAPDILSLMLDCMETGSGKPAVYNDDRYIPLLMETFPELPYEDAAMLGFGGCTETMIGGMSSVDSLVGTINTAKALEYALFDGRDARTGQQVGPKTGRFTDFAAFDAFTQALSAQMHFMTDVSVEEWNRHLASFRHSGDPKIPRSLFTRDCVRSRRSFETGGARYNWSVVSYDGTTVVIDSLAAIRTLVFERREISPDTLIAALRADFKGYESIREQLKKAPKFGNDDFAADIPGARVLEDAWGYMMTKRSPRANGRYIPSVILFATYEESGRSVAATPDGRGAGKPLNDSIGACAGCDVNGPTALLNSVLRLPQSLALGTPVLNLRFGRRLFDTEGRERVLALIRSYFERGGLQLQVSVLSREEMLAAQQDPEHYRDLIVRIGGYSEYFVRLSRGLQDSVILRTEY